MSRCYCCKRETEEVRTELLAILKEEFEGEEKFVRLEMEAEDKKVLDLQEEWEAIKSKASKDLGDFLGLDVLSLLKPRASNEGPDLSTYLEKAETVLGNSLKNFKLEDVEKEIRDKIDKVKNLGEFNERLAEARAKYEERAAAIRRDGTLISAVKVAGAGWELEVPVCKACAGIGAGSGAVRSPS